MTIENLVVRGFRSEDARALVILHNSASESFEENNITEDFIKEIANRSDFRFFVVSDKDKVIGFVGVLYHKEVCRAEIGPICIDANYRRKGVGTLALNYALNFLKNEGLRRVIAKVKVKNTPALGFFMANGFNQEGYFMRYTNVGEDVIQLVKFI